jgi:hypothetical protein
MKTSKFIRGFMVMSVALILAAIMTSCNEERFESLLESHDAATENAGGGLVNGSEAAEHYVVTVYFFDKEEMTIATRASGMGMMSNGISTR